MQVDSERSLADALSRAREHGKVALSRERTIHLFQMECATLTGQAESKIACGSLLVLKICSEVLSFWRVTKKLAVDRTLFKKEERRQTNMTDPNNSFSNAVDLTTATCFTHCQANRYASCPSACVLSASGLNCPLITPCDLPVFQCTRECVGQTPTRVYLSSPPLY